MPTSRNTPVHVVIHVRTVDARRRARSSAGLLQTLSAPRLRSFVKAALSCAFLALAARTGAAQGTRPVVREPIIDMHLHALHADDQGPYPQFVCPGEGTLPAPPTAASMQLRDVMACAHPLRSSATDSSVMTQTLAMMSRFNMRGVVSGDVDMVRRWKAAAHGRLFPAVTDAAPLDSIPSWVARGDVAILGELAFQYAGIGPGDSLPERWIALGERLDVPVAIHVGPGPPGAPYLGAPAYRMRLSNPLLLEDVLVRHPKARVYVMHAGWPFADEMIALLWAHPQVYVDIGVIDWAVPRREFDAYLKRLVDAGFGKRIMYGSDQMVWPEAIRVSIERIEGASYLSKEQKRDILYNNAARFLRL